MYIDVLRALCGVTEAEVRELFALNSELLLAVLEGVTHPRDKQGVNNMRIIKLTFHIKDSRRG